jgi:hypothetical protein
VQDFTRGEEGEQERGLKGADGRPVQYLGCGHAFCEG